MGRPMKIAYWQDVLLAESDKTIEIEGTLYFPREGVRMEYLEKTATNTRCPWKGNATYFNILVGKAILIDSAWSYERPKPRGHRIKGHVAFWKEVLVSGT